MPTDVTKGLCFACERPFTKGSMSNHPPDIPCHLCGKPATQVWVEGRYSDEGWLCDGCVAAEDYDGEILLPVVNSPRMGVCGYTGQNASW